MSLPTENYVHPNDGRVTAIPGARADTSLPEQEQDQNISRTYPSRPGAQDSTPAGLTSATGGIPSSGAADQGSVAPQSATTTHVVGGIGYPTVGTAQSGDSVGRGLASTERTAGQDTALSAGQQDANIVGSFASRPGAQENTPLGVSSGVGSNAVSNTAQIGAVSSATGEASQKARPGEHGYVGPSTTGSNTLSASEQDANIARSFASRPGASEQTPLGVSSGVGSNAVSNTAQIGAVFSATGETGTGSNTLSASEQDANIASTQAARPGAQDTTPAGVKDSSLVNTAKSTLDSVAERTTGTKSASEQLPSAQSVANTAQEAAESVARGASSLLAGISNLALGAKDTASDTAAMSHPESDNARDVEDLHIPGAFESETSDRDDLNAVRQSLPSTEQLTGSSRPLTEQARDTARSAQDRAQQGVNYAKEQLPGATTSSSGSTGLNAPASAQAQAPSTVRNFSLPSAPPTTTEQTAPIVTTGIASADAPKVSVKDGPAARDMPDLVADSQKQAGEAAPLDLPAYSAGQEMQKREALGRPDSDFTGSAGTSDPSSVDRSLSAEGSATAQSSNGSGIGGAIAGGLAAAGTAAAGAAQYAREKTHQATGTDPVSILPESAQKTIDPQTAASTNDSALQRGAVPEVVRDSQRAAGVGPEAGGNPFAVQEKNDVESELKREVQPAQPSSENNRATGVLAGGLAGVGTAVTSAAASAREKTQDVTGTDPVSFLPDSAQRNINQSMSTTTGPASESYPPVPRNHRTEVAPTPATLASTGPEPGKGVQPLEAGTTSSQGTSDLLDSAARPDHLGAASNIPRNTVESSSAPDVSYEHRPKTLLQTEIAARERERGLGEGATTIAQPIIGASHGGPSLNDVDLHSGVKNTVVGAGSAHPLSIPQLQDGGLGGVPHRGSAEFEEVRGPVAHIRDDLERPDLSAGVRNGVIGAGARDGEGTK